MSMIIRSCTSKTRELLEIHDPLTVDRCKFGRVCQCPALWFLCMWECGDVRWVRPIYVPFCQYGRIWFKVSSGFIYLPTNQGRLKRERYIHFWSIKGGPILGMEFSGLQSWFGSQGSKCQASESALLRISRMIMAGLYWCGPRWLEVSIFVILGKPWLRVGSWQEIP